MSDSDISALARAKGPRAIEVLENVMENAVEDRDRIRAAEGILDRGYGKAAQAIIAVPANRRQAALLASLSDEDLVAVIEQKQLPRIGASQPMVTIGAKPRGFQNIVMPNSPLKSSHGPAEETYAEETSSETSAIDPLLL